MNGKKRKRKETKEKEYNIYKYIFNKYIINNIYIYIYINTKYREDFFVI